MSEVTFDSAEYSDIVECIESIEYPVDRIAVLVSRLEESEGAGNVALSQLESLREAGYETAVVTFDATKEPVDAEFIKLSSTPSWLSSHQTTRLQYAFWPKSQLRIARQIRNYDLVIVHQPVLCPIAYLSKQLYGLMAIYYNHHVTDPDEKEGLVGSVYGQTAYRVLLRTSSHLSAVVSVSKHSRDAYSRRFGKSGPVIYNRIDHNRYNRDVSGMAIRERYSLGDRPIILFVGRLTRSKRVHELIEVYEMVLQAYPEAVLIIVGRENDDDYKRQLTEQKRRSDGTILFTGIVPEEDLPKYYAAADVYTTCSEKEGFNLTIAEAEACGTVTVAYDIGAHSEVMKLGTLVELGRKDCFSKSIIDALDKMCE